MRVSLFLALVFALYFLGALGAHDETTESVERSCPAGAAEDWWDHTETGTDVEGCSNPSNLQTAATIGCTMSIKFKGTAAHLNALMAFDRGFITVSIDGGSSERVDASGGLIGRKCGELWSRTNLENKDHTLLITIVATGGDGSAKFEFVSLRYTVPDTVDQPPTPNPPTPSSTTANDPPDPQTSPSQTNNPSTPTSSTTLLSSDQPSSSGLSSTQPTSAADRAQTSDSLAPSNTSSQANQSGAAAAALENGSTSTVPTGAIAGAAVGAVALVAFLIVLFLLYRRRQRRVPNAPVSPFFDTRAAPIAAPHMSQGPHSPIHPNFAQQNYSSSGLVPNRTPSAQEYALPYPYNFGNSLTPGSQDSHVPLSPAYPAPLTVSSRTESSLNDSSTDRGLRHAQAAPVNEKSPRLVDISAVAADHLNRRSVAAGSVITSSSRTGGGSEGRQRAELSESEIERIAQRVAALSAHRAQMPPPAYE